MDIIGVGSPELLLLLFLAGVILGPRRLVTFAREAGKYFRMVQSLGQNIKDELNREIDLLEAAERKPNAASDPSSSENESEKPQLPEAYRRFREDFPQEGQLEDPALGKAGENGTAVPLLPSELEEGERDEDGGTPAA